MEDKAKEAKEEKGEEKGAEEGAEKGAEKDEEKGEEKDQEKDEEKDEQDEKQERKKSVQPKDEVGTRKGCRRYKWEFKDSNKEFWVMGLAEVKILSVGCLAAAMLMFTGTPIHPLITLILTMELSIFCFFFIIYTLAINRYLPFILWPVSEILNDLFAFIFLVGALVFAVKIRQTMPLHYFIAVVLIGLAGFFALIDICLQRKHFMAKGMKENVLVAPPRREKGEAKKPDAEKPEAGKPEAGKPDEGKPEAGKPKAEKPAAVASGGASQKSKK